VRNCPWYNRGFCKHGPNCRNEHVRKEACPRYLAGFCPDGPTCKLGHPKYELPDDVEDDDEFKDSDEKAIPTYESSVNIEGEEDEMAHARNRMRRGVMVCMRCGGEGHLSTLCMIKPVSDEKRRRRGLRAMSEVTCFKCGTIGHYANACPNPRAPPPPGGYKLPGWQPHRVALDKYSHKWAFNLRATMNSAFGGKGNQMMHPNSFEEKDDAIPLTRERMRELKAALAQASENNQSMETDQEMQDLFEQALLESDMMDIDMGTSGGSRGGGQIGWQSRGRDEAIPTIG